jgi:cytochrome c
MGKNLETNKIFASILIALLVALISTLVADVLVKPDVLSNPIYVVEGMPASNSKEEALPQEEEILPEGDIEAGKQVLRKCLQCHTVDQQGAHRIGPKLWGIVGRQHASFPDFPYSKAAKEKTGVWDDESLNQFLKNPRVYMPGTKMAFAGLKKIVDRADLIAYLKTLRE